MKPSVRLAPTRPAAPTAPSAPTRPAAPSRPAAPAPAAIQFPPADAAVPTGKRARPPGPRPIGASGPSHRRDEEGSIIPLMAGLFAVVALLIVTGIAITSAQLVRTRLYDAADGAALRAANSLDASAYLGGVTEAVPVTDESVVGAAAGYLDEIGPPAGVVRWGLQPGSGTPDGRTAVVVLAGEARLPLVGSLLEAAGGSVTITVTSRARADLLP